MLKRNLGFSHLVGLIITRPTQAASRTDVPAEPYDFDSSHRTLAQILARLKSYWSSGWISATAETLFIAPGESAMAALGRTEDTEAAAAPRKCEEEEGWRRKRGDRGEGGGRGRRTLKYRLTLKIKIRHVEHGNIHI